MAGSTASCQKGALHKHTEFMEVWQVTNHWVHTWCLWKRDKADVWGPSQFPIWLNYSGTHSQACGGLSTLSQIKSLSSFDYVWLCRCHFKTQPASFWAKLQAWPAQNVLVLVVPSCAGEAGPCRPGRQGRHAGLQYLQMALCCRA